MALPVKKIRILKKKLKKNVKHMLSPGYPIQLVSYIYMYMPEKDVFGGYIYIKECYKKIVAFQLIYIYILIYMSEENYNIKDKCLG